MRESPCEPQSAGSRGALRRRCETLALGRPGAQVRARSPFGCHEQNRDDRDRPVQDDREVPRARSRDPGVRGTPAVSAADAARTRVCASSTSRPSPVAEPIVDYYLVAAPADLRDDARDAADDALSRRPLAPPALRQAAGAPDAAHPDPLGDPRPRGRPPRARTSAPSSSTRSAMRSASRSMGADPALAYLGTKSGGRELFARAGVAHPLGVEHVRSRADVIAAIARLRAVRPRLAQVGGQARRRRLRRGQRDRRAARPRARAPARSCADRRARRRDAPAGRRLR